MKKKHTYLIILLILFTLTGCNSQKEEKDNNNSKDDYNITNTTNEETSSDNKSEPQIEKKGHTIESSVGKFIIDKDGSVYYINFKELTLLGVKYTLTESDLSILGTKNTYKNYTYQNEPSCSIETGCEIEGYKLDLSNISSAYEVYFGNGASTTTIIFLSYDGLVHELTFEIQTSNINIELKKDVCNCQNIVSVVPNVSFSGSSALLIDKNGNKYNYTSALN